MAFNTGLFGEVIEEMKKGVYDYTKDGKCSGCGSCCTNFLPMSEKEVKIVKRYIRKHQIKEQKHTLPTANPTMDLTCPFRDNVGRRCVIYEVRPAICRDFQCDKPKKGIMANRDMYEERLGIVMVRETFFGKEDSK